MISDDILLASESSDEFEWLEVPSLKSWWRSMRSERRQSSIFESQASSQLAVKTSKLDELFLLCWFLWLLLTALFGFCLFGDDVIDEDTELVLCFDGCLCWSLPSDWLLFVWKLFIITLPGSFGFWLEVLPELFDHCFQNWVFVALILVAKRVLRSMLSLIN